MDRPKPYDTLIDTETWDFIDSTLQWYPTDTVEYSIDKQREIYNTMCTAFFKGHAQGVEFTDSIISTDDYELPIRCYKPSINSNSNNTDVQLFYFHGGGFVVGGIHSHDDVCSDICANTGFEVTSVDYRLSPEHAHPAAFNDALAAIHYVANASAIPETVPIVLCGDSAGANLAAAAAHALRKEKINIVGQVLIYPGLGGDINAGSYITHAHAPMLSTDEVRFYSTIRTNGQVVEGDPTLAPLHDTDFTDLPPTAVFSAECDPLSDDGRDYCNLINASGGHAIWLNETGLVHGYLRARTSVQRAKQSFLRISNTIMAMGERTF